MSLENEKSGYSIDRNIHFTYKPDPNMETLCQGDVLEITEELSVILEKVHPYFLNEQYKFFVVLSQSCDLVRRNGKTCKTPYITLAAVRSYSDFLERMFLDGKYVEKVDKLLIMDEKNKDRAYQLVERVYNNTEPEYFFLYKEDALDFPESMVAYLKVSIALRSKEHYDVCLKAKKLNWRMNLKQNWDGWLAICIPGLEQRIGMELCQTKHGRIC